MQHPFSELELIDSSVQFPSGSNPGDTECFRATLLVDGIVEGEEVVTLTMESSDAAISGDIQLTINDSTEDLQGKMHGIMVTCTSS